MYLKATQLARKTEIALIDKAVEYGHRRNIRFYVAACAACELTKMADPSAHALEVLDVKTMPDDLILKCYERVWKKYNQLGAIDSVSKGPDLLKKLRADIKRKFSKEAKKSA